MGVTNALVVGGATPTTPRHGRVQYKLRLLQSLQANLRLQHLSRRTEAAYVYWSNRFSPLLFLFRNVVGRSLEELGRLPRGRVPTMLPVVLTPGEVARVLAWLRGTHRLVGLLLYGSGLR